MLINLKSRMSDGESGQVAFELDERLPQYLESPCSLNCQYSIQSMGDYFILTLSIAGSLTLICQRCLHSFPYHYVDQTTLAICHSEGRAEELMERYDCVVAENYQINLKEIITDELHLSLPESHLKPEECDSEMGLFISNTEFKSSEGLD